MTEKPQTSKVQYLARVSPIQANQPEVSNLQTPSNEEKGKKRQVKDPTPPKESSQQPQAKRQKLNPLPEVESIDESFDEEREDSPLTGSVSEVYTGHKGK